MVNRPLLRVLAVAALFATGSTLAACQAPADDHAVVRLQNDLGTRVAVAGCKDAHCHELVGNVNHRLSPGESLPVNVDTDGVASYYRVAADGDSLSCVRLVVHRTPERSIVPLSSAVGCGSAFQAGEPGIIGSILGWAFLLVLLAAGLGITVRVTQGAYRRFRPLHGDAASVMIAGAAGLGAFVGGWLPIGLFWLGRWAARRFRPPAPAT